MRSRSVLVVATLLLGLHSAFATPQTYSSPDANAAAAGGYPYVHVQIYAGEVFGVSGQAHFITQATLVYNGVPLGWTALSLEGFLPDANTTSVNVSGKPLVFEGNLSLPQYAAGAQAYLAICGYTYAVGDSNLAEKSFLVAANSAGAGFESVQQLAGRANLGALGAWNVPPLNTGIGVVDDSVNFARAVVLGIGNVGWAVISSIGHAIASAWNWLTSLFGEDGSKASTTINNGRSTAISNQETQYIYDLATSASSGTYSASLGGSYGFGISSPLAVTTTYQPTVASGYQVAMCSAAASAAQQGNQAAVAFLMANCSGLDAAIAAAAGPYSSLGYQCTVAAQMYGLGNVLANSAPCRCLYYGGGAACMYGY